LAGITGLAAAATVTACAGKALDVGADEPTGSGGSDARGGTGSGATGANTSGVGASGSVTYGGPPVEGADWPDPAACMPAPNSPLVGSYKGRWPLTNYYAEPKGDAVLTIKGLTADGQPCGTLHIGAGDPPPPATDPDAPYPPRDANDMLDGAKLGVGLVMAFPGVEYQIHKVESSPSRLAFSIAYNEVMRSWCGLQTRFPGADSCLPGNYSASQDPSGCSITPEGGMPMSLPCIKLSYCTPYVCVCDDAGCDAAPQATRFDLHWDDGNLEGSLNTNTPIFLDRVP
jgi:hypothetical protein